MKKLTLSAVVSIAVVASLTGCDRTQLPMPAPTSSSSSQSTNDPEPTPTSTPTETGDPEVVDAAAIAPRIGATCDDLISASQRASLLGVPAADIEAQRYPLANGSAAELQAGVLSCHWLGPNIGDESIAQIAIEILPDASAEFAAFAPYLSGDEVLGSLSTGSTISCYEYDDLRACAVHYLAGSHWVDASYSGINPGGKSDSTAAATGFAALITGALSSAGPLGPAFVPPAASTPAWSSCSTLDASGAYRSALASPSLIAPEPEFTGAGTLFSEAWQRVNFKSCAWRQADPYVSPVGQIRMATVSILPGGGWAWPQLRQAYEDLGASSVTIAGATEAMMNCFDDDNCSIDALVDGSYVGVYLSVDQYRGGAPALAVAAAEFAIARL